MGYKESAMDAANICDIDITGTIKKMDSRFPTGRLLITGIFVVLGGGFNFGFQVSVINPMGESLQRFLLQSLQSRYGINFSELSIRVFWSSVAAIIFIGAVIGASLITSIIKYFGSRFLFILIGTLMIISVFLSPLSKHTNIAELFILSRFFVGICIGMGTTVQGVFLTEISPVSCRGFMGTLIGLSTNIGAILASAIGLPQIFGTDNLWPYAYYVELIACIMHVLYSTFFLQENPKYFLRRENEQSANKETNFHGDEKDVDETLKEHAETDVEEKKFSWITFLTDRTSRKTLTISILLNCTVSFSGIMAMVFFGTSLLGTAGFTPNRAAIANFLAGFSGTIGILIQAVTIDKMGRRILLLGSLLSLITINAGMMTLVWIFEHNSNFWIGYCFLILFVLFLFFFSIGIGPLAWFIGAELAQPQDRARVQSLSTSAQYITCFLCPILYLPCQKLIGPFSFLIFICPLVFATYYVYFNMPETRNCTSEEIYRLLQLGKFR
ncbi:unnamed protein product [Thelazia callipaeda]|uniref:MFS domain-containing protein n=1 Tax=Thelazia callipaeda TaxID=103827 RepID=A0A0N5D5J5_THECL|nr:unnamed protein product [Thelazia callipaeda]